MLLLPVVLSGCQSSGPSAVLVEARTATTAGDGVWNGPKTGLLAAFREPQFAYRTPLEVSDGGRFMRIPYDEKRDINQRDEIPVRKVKSWYVSPLPAGAEREGTYGTRGLKVRGIGALDGGSKLTVIYIHGRGGNRDWGFADERFGGNFNRLKHMILRAGGAYISPDFTDFDRTGYEDVSQLVTRFRPLTKGKLVVACGSMGNVHCWQLAADAAMSAMIDGLVVLAGFPDNRSILAAASRPASRHVPLVIGHGSWDPTFDYKPMLELYRRVREKAPSYPARFLLFDTGKHGAPVRMIDWRDTLNWIAAQ